MGSPWGAALNGAVGAMAQRGAGGQRQGARQVRPPSDAGSTGSFGNINDALQHLRGAVGYNPMGGRGTGMTPWGGSPWQQLAGPNVHMPPTGTPWLGGGPGIGGNPTQPPPTVPPPQDLQQIQNKMSTMQTAVPPAIDSFNIGQQDQQQLDMPPVDQQGGQLQPEQPGVGGPNTQVPPNAPPPPPNTMMGAHGGVQQLGNGRFGGNPPGLPGKPMPPVAPTFPPQGSGGIMDRRQALNDRLNQRIQGFNNNGTMIY